MSLSLVTGRANSGKTGVAYERIRAALRAGESAVLLVPGRPDVNRAVDELSREFPLGVRVHTIDGYLRESWERLGDGRAIVSSASRRVLLSSVARRCGLGSRGLADLAERCVRRISDTAGSQWRVSRPAIDGPGAELCKLISAYLCRLEELDLIELADVAYELVGESEPVDRVVVAHRFNDFSAPQEALLVGAANAGAEVTVTLDWEEGFAPTEALDPLVKRLLAAGAVASPVGAQGAPSDLTELAAIESRLFAAPRELDSRGAVRLSTAEGLESEATRVAAEVQRLLLEETVSPDHIAVAFRAPERHVAVLRDAFRRAGIEADFDAQMPLGSTGFGRAFLSLVRFAAAGERADLLSFLHTRFSGADPGELALQEARWRRADVRDSSRLDGDIPPGWEPAAMVSRAALRIAQRPIDRERAKEWFSMACTMYAAGHGRGVVGELADEDSRALGVIGDVLSDIAEFGDGTVTVGELAQLVAERRLTPREVERPGRVQVAGVDRIQARRFDAVVLGGLSADEFPAAQVEDTLPGSAVAGVVEAFGGQSGAGGGAAFERLLFYLTVTRAKRFLVLSTCTANADGETLQSSSLLEELLDFYRDGESLTLPHTHRSLAEVPELGAETTGRASLVAEAYAGGGDSLRLRTARSRARYGSAPLADEAVLEALAARETFSASDIETYLACPYRWFYERAVRPEAVDRQFGVTEQGTFAHELLATFYQRFVEEGGHERVTPSNVSIAGELVDELFAEAVEREGRVGVAIELSRREALRWVHQTVSDDAGLLEGFRPRAAEWAFFEEPVDLGEYRLVGRVDRVDIDDSGQAVVTDYKRSQTIKAADILKQGKVQIPLYLAAVESALGLKPVGGIYRSLRGRENRGMLLSDAVPRAGFTSTDMLSAEDFSALREGAAQLASEAVRGMRSGTIPRAPRASNACTYCAAASTCGGGAR